MTPRLSIGTINLRWAALLGLVLLVACGKVAEPTEQVELTVSVQPASASLAVISDGSETRPTALSSAMEGESRVFVYRLTAGKVRLTASAPGHHGLDTVLSVEGPGSVGIAIMLTEEATDDAPRSLVIDAGQEGVAAVGEQIRLHGTLTSEGIVGNTDVEWMQASGPGDVTFDSPNSLTTFAAFNAPGLYTLELRATADGISVSDTVAVHVVEGESEEPTPEVPDEDPSVPGESTRIGLHVTQQELDIWRSRATSGPYKVVGDVSQNSPGDWVRISKNADSFLRDPNTSHWEGPGGSGCIVQADWHYIAGMHLPRDAAFVYLVTGNHEYRDAVKEFLLTHARKPGLDLSDRSRWCLGSLSDSTFGIANWFTMMLFAYDYLGDESFSPDEHDELAEWFLSAAAFFESDTNKGALDKLFVDRHRGNYELTGYATGSCGRVTHYDGWPTCALHRYYNNRRAALVRYYGIVGIKFDRPELIDSAKLFVREFVRFSIFPDGVMGEYERWRADLPDLGWAYAATTLGSLFTLADHLARIGDFELYEFHTSEGALGSEGGDKSLLLAVRTLQALVTGEREMYGSDSGTGSQYLVDGVHVESGWHGVHDVVVAPANRFFVDPEIEAVYTRTHGEVSPYPAAPAGIGPHPVWTGESGLFPGILFMFGGTENAVAYPVSMDVLATK